MRSGGFASAKESVDAVHDAFGRRAVCASRGYRSRKTDTENQRMTRKRIVPSPSDPAAGNGLLNRRLFFECAFAAAATSVGAITAEAEPLTVQPWMKAPGAGFQRLRPALALRDARSCASSWPRPIRATQGVGTARTPLHLLDGIITPSGLHFERSHSGIPDIDPDQHRLVIHGLVRQPLVFTLEALHRYPMESRIAFIECAGNSARSTRRSRSRSAWPRSTASSAARNGPA